NEGDTYRWVTGESNNEFPYRTDRDPAGACGFERAATPPGGYWPLDLGKCDQPLPFTCAKPAWVDWRPNGHAYREAPAETTFDGAVASCTALGGHVLTVTSEVENMFSMRFPGIVWLYSRKADTDRDFHWFTGEPFVFRNFAPGEPDGAGP